ncbi:hypothetical protein CHINAEXTREME_16770 [Halobiforma lacisalsi AJ5]|uniref:CopG family transcriptional regulator n=1 Tax=Natronobacterium lacisalsi AJ5 TaxID=358396 RepID=M0LNX4_NATLA|nr:hypothetical protein [Halobiforma lacisalsi]APW99323.1 hypothetical protein CHINAEXTREME_16770 [Halobiforma lacisalsi AJ5]EMA35247.1 hypothetical protein C445_05993 [Halobiforma lacisalsi AJ5]
MGRNDADRTSSYVTSTTVELPTTVVEGIESRLDHSEFDTVDEYAAYALEEVLARLDEPIDGGDEGVNADADADAGDTVEKADVEARLKSLGYLD